MAQEIEVKIKVDSTEATRNVDTFGKSVEQAGKKVDVSNIANDKAQKGIKDYAGELVKSSKLSQVLSQATGGLSDAFMGAIKGIDLTKLSLASLKGAIISTGIGALVILLGFLIEKMVEMFSSTKRSERALENLTTSIDKQAKAFSNLTEQNKFANDLSMKYAKANGETKDQLDKRNEAYYQSEKRRIEAEIVLNERKRAVILRNEDLNDEDRKKALDKNKENGEKVLSDAQKNYRDNQNLKADNYARDKSEEKKNNDDRIAKQEASQQKSAQALAQQKEALKNLDKKYAQEIENLGDKTDQQKLDREKSRALKELDAIKLSEKEKAKVKEEILKDFALKQEQLEKDQAKKLLDLSEKLAKDKETLMATTDAQKLALAQLNESKALEIELTTIVASDEQKTALRLQLKDKFDLQLTDLKVKQLDKENEEKVKLLEMEMENDNNSFENKKQLILDRETILLENKKLTEAERKQITIDTDKALQEVDKLAFDGKMELLKKTADMLGGFSDLMGKETVAGKSLAIAQATINAYVGISEVWKAKNVYPEPFGTGIKVASSIAMGLNAFKTVKSIMAVKVPASSGGGGGAPTLTAPTGSMPSANVIKDNGVNQLAGTLTDAPPIRTFVVANDVTSQQGLDRAIKSTATL